MIRVDLDGAAVTSLDLDDARTLAEALDMATSALASGIADSPPRERLVTVRWHDGRRASRRSTA
mgnify:FL=1